MAQMAPILPFLRPLAPPKPSTIRQFLTGSLLKSRTNSACAPLAAGYSSSAVSRNTTSDTQQSTSTDESTTSDALKRKNRWPRQSKLATKSSNDGATPVSSENHVLLPYHVTRTPSNSLPVYKLAKAGGNRRLTRIRKISGNLDILKEDLRTSLGLSSEEVLINRLTNQIVVKGWHRDKIQVFLESKSF